MTSGAEVAAEIMSEDGDAALIGENGASVCQPSGVEFDRLLTQARAFEVERVEYGLEGTPRGPPPSDQSTITCGVL